MRNETLIQIAIFIGGIFIGALLMLLVGSKYISSLPQPKGPEIPGIPNKVLYDLAKTSANVRNVNLIAQAEGSLLDLEGEVLIVANEGNFGLRINANNDTIFTDVSNISEGAKSIKLSDLKVGDKVSISISVGEGEITALSVLRFPKEAPQQTTSQ